MTPAALPVLDAAAPRRAPPPAPALALVRDAAVPVPADASPAPSRELPPLRRAADADVGGVHALLEQFVAPGLLLPRSEAQVRRTIGDFIIAVQDGRVVGSVALRAYSPELAEIGALAVARELHGSGLGRRLVEAAIAEARRTGLKRVFALTLKDGFFHRLGFATTDIAEFPQKIAADCSGCARRHACEEVAVALTP